MMKVDISEIKANERVVWWGPCEDRRTREFEYLLPELKQAGRCNSSHGGSCCVCAGKLGDIHIHLNSVGDDSSSIEMGGNVCSEGCVGRFLSWIEAGPNTLEICPGHGQPLSSFGKWPYREKKKVRLIKEVIPT